MHRVRQGGTSTSAPLHVSDLFLSTSPAGRPNISEVSHGGASTRETLAVPGRQLEDHEDHEDPCMWQGGLGIQHHVSLFWAKVF